MEDIKKLKVKFMTISKMTNTLDGIGNRVDIAKAMISELAGIAIETIQNETEKKNF